MTIDEGGERGQAVSARLLEVCRQLTGPGDDVLVCAIYQPTAPGVEMRVGYSEKDALHTLLLANVIVARTLAAEICRFLLAQGGFDKDARRRGGDNGATWLT